MKGMSEKMKDYESTSNVPKQDDTDANSSEDHSRAIENTNDNDESTDEDVGNEDSVQWDGSEAELVTDAEAEEYEEQYTGIKLKYSLNREEILSSIKHSKVNKNGRKNLIYHTVLLAIVSVFAILSYVIKGNILNLFIGAAGVIFIIVLWMISERATKRIANSMFSEKSMYVEIYPDNIVVGRDGFEMEIPLDGTSKFEEYDNMFIIYPPKSDILVIPIRTVEPDVIPEIQAMLLAGTTPKEDKKIK